MIKRCFVAVILLTFILFGCGRYDNVQPAKDENGGEGTMSHNERILMRYNFDVQETERVLKEALGTVFAGDIRVDSLLDMLDWANVPGAIQAEYHGNERGGRLDIVCENGRAYFMPVYVLPTPTDDLTLIVTDKIYDTERHEAEEDGLPIFWIE